MPKPLVVDASFTFRLLLPGLQQALCQSLVAGWLREGTDLCAPTLWLYEMTSALSKVAGEMLPVSEVKPDEGRRLLRLAHTLGIDLMAPDDDQARAAYDWTLRLKRAAAYDSFYLALAEGLACELWTADRRLYHAADQVWVRLLGEA